MEIKTNRILVTSFASNVARWSPFFIVQKKLEEIFVLVGRSMQRIYKAAKKCGYLKGLIEPVETKDAKKSLQKIKFYIWQRAAKANQWEQ